MVRKTKTKKSSVEHEINKLSILVSQDGLCFCRAVDKEIRVFHYRYFKNKQTPEELLEAMQSAEIMNILKTSEEQNATVKVFYAHSLFTVVPLPYFNQDKVSDYLKYNVRLLETDDLAYDQVDRIEANLIYIPYSNINNFIFERFGEFTFHHIAASFISNAIDLAGESDIPQVFLEAYPSHFMLSVIHDGTFLFCNDFDYQAPEDLVYYLLFIITQLELDSTTLQLHISGDMDKESESFDLLQTYIKNIKFIENDLGWDLQNTDLEQLPKHYFQLLLNSI